MAVTWRPSRRVRSQSPFSYLPRVTAALLVQVVVLLWVILLLASPPLVLWIVAARISPSRLSSPVRYFSALVLIASILASSAASSRDVVLSPMAVAAVLAPATDIPS